MKKILVSFLLCAGIVANAQEIIIEIPCSVYDDDEYLTGMGMSQAYSKDTLNAIQVAKQDALLEAISSVAQKIQTTSIYSQTSDNQSELITKSVLKYTFDLDDFQILCQQVKITEKGIIAYIAVCLPKSSFQNSEKENIQNLLVIESVIEDYTKDDSKKDCVVDESGMKIETYHQTQSTIKEFVRASFNLSAAAKFRQMTEQEDFDNRN